MDLQTQQHPGMGLGGGHEDTDIEPNSRAALV